MPRKGKPGARRRGAARKIAPAQREVRIDELDPRSRCGSRTQVQRLFRVVVSLDERRESHLVFFDRHGLYCEHGRQCAAVGDVQRLCRSLV